MQAPESGIERDENTGAFHAPRSKAGAGFANLRRLLSKPSGRFGLVCVSLIVVSAVFAPVLAPYDPTEIDVLSRLSAPSADHLLGTDSLGRDILSRLIYGARIALIASIPAVLFGAVLGLTLGIIAGYFSGKADSALLVLFDITRSFPAILLAITVITFTGPSLIVLVLIMGITRFPAYARLIRAQTLKVKEEEYITASQAIGSGTPRIMFRHLLPNVVAPLFIQAAMDIPVVVTFEAGLSFLGLGVPPPAPSWGTILKEGYLYARVTPWIITSSGLVLIVGTLGFTYLAEALRDTFDVKLRGTQ